MDALFAGVLAAWALRQPRLLDQFSRPGWPRALPPLALLTLWMGFAILLVGRHLQLSPLMQGIGYTWIALTYTSSLLCIVRNPRSDAISTRYLGLLSDAGLGAYAIYLFHQPVRIIMNRLIGNGPVSTCCATLLVAALAAAAWRLIEAPCMEFGRRRFSYRRPPINPVGAAGNRLSVGPTLPQNR
jgi:peptidoglycan/LPS O-acetylase OafA/YrhL